jgi:hypothetical protein
MKQISEVKLCAKSLKIVFSLSSATVITTFQNSKEDFEMQFQIYFNIEVGMLTFLGIARSGVLCNSPQFLVRFGYSDLLLSYWPKHLPQNFLLLYNAVGIATGYGLNDQGVGVRVPVGARIFTSPCRPDRLWGSPNLLSNGYRGLFPRG